MDRPPNLILATKRMDLKAIQACLEIDPASIQQTDAYKNNAVHLCIAGGSFRASEIVQFFIEKTDIDLLHKNRDGRIPLELAIAINDEYAIDLLEEPTHRQLTAAAPKRGPNPKLVP